MLSPEMVYENAFPDEFPEQEILTKNATSLATYVPSGSWAFSKKFIRFLMSSRGVGFKPGASRSYTMPEDPPEYGFWSSNVGSEVSFVPLEYWFTTVWPEVPAGGPGSVPLLDLTWGVPALAAL